MKKRICSLLLAIVMVIGLLPQTAHAADMVTVISTGQRAGRVGRHSPVWRLPAGSQHRYDQCVDDAHQQLAQRHL